MPAFVTSDQLSFVGFLGAVMVLVGYAMTAYGAAWLWLANFGFLLNWYGDSLDGTLARYRGQSRPLYGFYLDHNLDCVCMALMAIGAGLSAYMSLWVAMLIVVPYLMLDVFVMINAHLRNEFRLTFAKLGPTELRLILILVNTVFFCIEPLRTWACSLELMGKTLTLSALDIFGLCIVLILNIIYLTSFFADARHYAKIDPMPHDSV